MDAARERLLGRILPGVETACDLACGTGTTALALAREGIDMYAVDLSPRMCRLAREKAARARLPLHVVRGDMRSFRLPEAVDLITCEFDALNHVPRRADLRMVARAVARALRPGGHFFFDVNNSLGFERYWPAPFGGGLLGFPRRSAACSGMPALTGCAPGMPPPFLRTTIR